jgi:hypothetical protein
VLLQQQGKAKAKAPAQHRNSSRVEKSDRFFAFFLRFSVEDMSAPFCSFPRRVCWKAR